MNKDDKDEIVKLVAQTVTPLFDANDQLAGMLTAQRFLLEIVYANQFRHDIAGFDMLMANLITAARTKSAVAPGLPDDERAMEMRVHTVTQLQRFIDSTRRRITDAQSG